MLAGIAGETALEALRRLGGGGEEGSVVLTRANAQRVTDTLSNLRGAAMKLGQMLSLHGDDLLPPEFVQILSAVRNQAHFMPEDQVRAVLVRELGADWESKFAEFDFEPLAAASIGQVHDARGPDGAELALKIQYPGVDRSIGSDVDNLAVLLRVTRLLPAELELDPLLEEVKQELKREADYRREADNTERYGELCRDEPAVLVPGVHRSLSSRRVLATDRVFGLPIEDLRSPEHSQERRDRIGERLLGLVLRGAAARPGAARAVRVPLHADRPELRQLPVRPEQRAHRAARLRCGAALHAQVHRRLPAAARGVGRRPPSGALRGFA
jgi:predicted unusual protein kinase regulating ubiquinone biosynthesis (AarF/ABC1/UbiB family)